MDEFDKLEALFNHILAQNLIDVYVDENDSFVLEFDDNTLVEIFCDDGDLSIYYEMGQAEENLLH